MEDLVSIITPAYNSARYLMETIRSVQAQTYRQWELIIVDDGSDDDTASVALSTGDARIRCVAHAERKGAAAARNTALREARGRWIAFLDSDDLWEPRKLERQLRFMEEHGYAFSYTDYTEVDEAGRPIGRLITGPRHIGVRGMYGYCWPGCLTVMYDARKVGLVQTANVDITDDYAIWLQVVRHADCHLLAEPLGRHRCRSGSLSSRSLLYKVSCHYHLFRRVEKRWAAVAAAMTARNLVMGLVKKLLYVKRT